MTGGLVEAYGDAAEQMYAIFHSPDGWGDILGRFATITRPFSR